MMKKIHDLANSRLDNTWRNNITKLQTEMMSSYFNGVIKNCSSINSVTWITKWRQDKEMC